MSSDQGFNAGKVAGEAQAKTQEFVESAKGTAVEAKDHVVDATKSATNTGKDATETTKDHVANAAKSASDAVQPKEPSFLQQTGTNVTNMAQGAVETVKNAVGMNEKK